MLLAALLMGEAVWFVARRVGGDAGTDAAIRLIVRRRRRASWSTSACSSRSALPNWTSSADGCRVAGSVPEQVSSRIEA